jgi:3-mercaptopyruvate sulfurtransferase SseA
MRAAHTYLLLRSLGYPDVRVLDDAWRSLAVLGGAGSGR